MLVRLGVLLLFNKDYEALRALKQFFLFTVPLVPGMAVNYMLNKHIQLKSLNLDLKTYLYSLHYSLPENLQLFLEVCCCFFYLNIPLMLDVFYVVVLVSII